MKNNSIIKFFSGTAEKRGPTRENSRYLNIFNFWNADF